MRPILTPLAGVAALVLSTAPAIAQTQAQAHYPPHEMEEALEELRAETGAQKLFFFQTDRLEVQWDEDGEETGLWDINAWYGGRIHRLWIKSEAEYEFGHGEFEELEVQALYSRAISNFFDAQAGVRHDFKPDAGRSHAVVALQGEAPYWFEIDAAAYLSDRGEVSASLEVEYELLLTQRLILQPMVEFGWQAEAVPELELGAGLTGVEAGLRLRYEVRREIAPYVGLSWTSALGETRDIAQAAGAEIEATRFVVGLRTWF
ncbi:copper resistance protein B [Maricaulis sp. CAU 1757]